MTTDVIDIQGAWRREGDRGGEGEEGREGERGKERDREVVRGVGVTV